jgi:hypothetical protein
MKRFTQHNYPYRRDLAWEVAKVLCMWCAVVIKSSSTALGAVGVIVTHRARGKGYSSSFRGIRTSSTVIITACYNQLVVLIEAYALVVKIEDMTEPSLPAFETAAKDKIA